MRSNTVSLVLLIRRVQEDVALLILFHLNTRLHSSLQHWWQSSLSWVDVDVGTGLSLLEALVGAVNCVLVWVVVGVEQVINVGTESHVMLLVELTTVDDSEVFMVTIKGHCFMITVHSILVIFLRKTIFTVSNGISGGVAPEKLDQAISKLHRTKGLLRLVESSVLHIL